MFKNALRTGLTLGMAGRRIERRTKPSLEHLDDRIAPSGFSLVAPAVYHHVPTGSRTHVPFAVSAPPGQIVPDGGGIGR